MCRCPGCVWQRRWLPILREQVDQLDRKAHRAFEQQQPMKAVEVYEVTIQLRELLATVGG